MADVTIEQGGDQDYEIPQGETFTFTYTFVDKNKVPINLTGYKARTQFRQSVSSTTKLYEGTTTDEGIANGHLTIDGPNGKVTLKIPAATTEAWTWRKAKHDIEVISPSGAVTRLAKGSVKVDPEVTRPT